MDTSGTRAGGGHVEVGEAGMQWCNLETAGAMMRHSSANHPRPALAKHPPLSQPQRLLHPSSDTSARTVTLFSHTRALSVLLSAPAALNRADLASTALSQLLPLNPLSVHSLSTSPSRQAHWLDEIRDKHAGDDNDNNSMFES